MSLAIIADDLTGAADCAARSHHAGLSATILVGPPAIASPASSEVIALTSESRDAAPAEAAGRVRRIMKALGPSGNWTWYKKIDSTLRGNLGAELDAMLVELAVGGVSPCAVISPAFPAHQRGLENGYLVWDQGRARPVHLPGRLREQTRRRIVLIPLSDVRCGVSHLAQRLLGARQEGAELLVVDALTDGDLRNVCLAARQTLADAILCGSAGLAGAWAEGEAPQGGVGASSRKRAWPVPAGPILAVIGSGSAVAHQQIERVRRTRRARLVEMGVEEADDEVRIGSVGDRDEDWLLHLPCPGDEAVLDPACAARLARTARAAVTAIDPAALILSGGATAIAVLGELGVTSLAVVRELLAGMPLASGVDARGRDRLITLKAGSHGDSNVLIDLFDILHGR